ncbi:phosphate starvation-inducible protein PsiF [Chitinimonas arctica]|uniref:Phosphate starvation-inducible protein PsiF n=1 Tax=Chitinimonas arctica TaxID=2594795 RepID=A0A516SDW5_9NEIS|nr:PsiF family protein [Chitinimonas arctica]QDQ26341.1 phosphate starvation-inducible protein PsiF [Chitinimonas arctica]
MKHLTLLAFALCTLGMAHAADEPNKQQSKMGQCNKDAGDKKGDERKKFMSECLKTKVVTQQSKMKTCNQEATGKKGDERKKFMSECLKKPAEAAEKTS